MSISYLKDLESIQVLINAIHKHHIQEGSYSSYSTTLQQLNDSYEYLRKLEQAKYKSLPPEERYYKDPWFKKIVDVMEQSITQGDFTTAELKDAVNLASARYHDY